MAAPIDFKYVQLMQSDERYGRASMREMHGDNWWRMRGRATWAGFAAERALWRSINRAGAAQCDMAHTFAHDLDLYPAGRPAMEGHIQVEVKTRCVLSGWVHPEKFDYINVPMHQDREPIKVGDQGMVVFCWYSMSDRRSLWVLGYVRGMHEFQRRSTWYEGNSALPRGGWAGEGGAYVIEVKQLRPLPDELLKEKAWAS